MMNPILIKAFGACTAESKPFNDKQYVFNEALKRGFLVPPEIINEDLVRFLDSETVDYNSTFYKNWDMMRSRTRFEQLIDQLLHYASTYGTNFEGNPFILNDEDRSDVPDYKVYKVIEYVGVGVVVKRCIDLLTSGIAMSNDLVTACVDYIVDHAKALPQDFEVEDIQNREAMIQICDRLGIHPKSGLGMVRWMVYKATGNALLIKDERTIRTIKMKASTISFGTFEEKDLIELSKVFFRFKPIFLAFRSYEPNKHYINKIRRLANTYHQPMEEGFWQTVLGEEKSIGDIMKRVDDLDNFKIIALLQIINERFELVREGGIQAYFVRNGSAWTKKSEEVSYNMDYLDDVYGVLYDTLIKRLSMKAGIAKFPTSIDLACPVSEKKFAGNLPYGSAYKMSDHNYFGIYWREADGTKDFDLSFLDKNGWKIGWNAGWNLDGGDVLFSGDMTTARPEATELLYFRGSTGVEGTLWCNRFHGDEGSKYRYFMGRQEINDFGVNYMVDPNTVEFEEWSTSENAQEMMGVVYDNKIYPCKFGFGRSIVSNGVTANDRFSIMKRKLNSVLDLRQVLLDAGFEEWNKDMKWIDPDTQVAIPVTPDYDFTNLDKDTLIKLFSNEE